MSAGMVSPSTTYSMDSNGNLVPNTVPTTQTQPGIPQISPISVPALPSTGPVLTVNGEASQGMIDKALQSQMDINDRMADLQAVGMGINGGIGLLNGITSWVALGLQNNAVNRHYDYMNKVADNGMEVALAQVGLQETALDYQRGMQQDQISHEQELARIEQRTAKMIADAEQRGKTERASIYAANNAFRDPRGDYFYG